MRSFTRLLDKCLELLTYRLGIFVYYSVYRVNAGKKSVMPQNPNPFAGDVAIILQGPITKFTHLACRYYLHNFKDLNVILSTWIGEDTDKFIKYFSNRKFHLIKSEKPIYEGISNINLQIVSTRKGILKAKDLKCEYVIKSRTDQIMLARELLNNLYFIVKNYGVSKSGINRIVVSERNTFVSRIYGVSDMFQFGRIDDILNYWQCELDDREWKDIELSKTVFTEEEGYSKLRLAELYVSTNYLENVGHKLKYTLDDSLYCFREYFVIIDNDKSILLWNKYGRNSTRLQNQNRKFRELDFLMWLRLHNDLEGVKGELG